MDRLSRLEADDADVTDSRQVALTELYTASPKAIWRYVRSQPLCYWLVCGYLFFEYVRPQSIYSWLDIFPWPSFFAVSALLTAFFDREPKPKGNILNRLIVLFLVVALLSSAFAVWPTISFHNLGAYYDWVVIYFAIILIVHTRKRFFVFFLLYLLCNFKMSQHGFLSWAMRGFSFASWGVTGSPGWFQNSGEFGIELCIYVPLAIAFIMALRSRWNRIAKIFFYLMPITGIGSVMASSSRGAFIGLAGTGLWSIKSSRYFIRAIVLLVVLGGIVWWATPQDFKARFHTAGQDRDSEIRLDRWHKAWETMKEYPMFGVGFKNWDLYYRSRLNYGLKGTAKVHNMFLECGSENGFVGLITFLAIYASMFGLNRRTRKYAKEHDMRLEYYLSHGFDAALIGLAISGSFVTVFYYPFVWINAALITCLYNSTCRPGIRHE